MQALVNSNDGPGDVIQSIQSCRVKHGILRRNPVGVNDNPFLFSVILSHLIASYLIASVSYLMEPGNLESG